MQGVNVESVGLLVALAYACLPVVSDVIANFQAVGDFRTRQRLFKDGLNIDTNNCGVSTGGKPNESETAGLPYAEGLNATLKNGRSK